MPAEVGQGLRSRAARWIPHWWAGGGGIAGALLASLLLPAEVIYGAAIDVRNLGYDRGWRRVERVPVPVVSVGNLGVGGAGKTPFAARLAGELERAGRRPAIALRGYGEDEILLHRELNPAIPVFAAARRAEAARAAVAAGREIVVLDDGFQHRALARDLDLVLLPVERWGTQRRLLPRGPWREPASALRRADAIVLTRKTARPEEVAAARAETERLARGIPLIQADLVPAGLRPLHGGESSLDALQGEAVLAVAALADPAPFAEQLRASGAQVELLAFPDHHPFTTAEAEALVRRTAGRPLVMTQKDAVKLRPLLAAEVPAYVQLQRVEIHDGHASLCELLRQLPRAGGR